MSFWNLGVLGMPLVKSATRIKKIGLKVANGKSF